MSIDVDAFLAHYGVMGMKWGVRKEEPLVGRKRSSGDITISKSRSSSPSSAQPRRSAPQQAQQHRGLTDDQKKLLVGAAVVAGILATTTLSYRHLDKLVEKNAAGKRIAESLLQNGSIFKKDASLAGAKSIDEIMSTITPNINPNYKKVKGYNVNCRRTTFAYELNRRGFAVEATGSEFAWGQDNIGLQNALRKAGKEKITPLSAVNIVKTHGKTTGNINPYLSKFKGEMVKDVNSLSSAFDKHPNGARGEIVLNVTKKATSGKTQRYGHSMAWEKIDGKTYIIDNQTNRHWPADDAGLAKLYKGWGTPSHASILRLDDKDLNMEFLSRWAQNRG